jgi:hypothetical protein
MDSRYIRFILAAIAILLAVLVIRQYTTPSVVRAQSYGVYVEPGYTMIRSPDGLTQVKGKIVINLNNGEIWGFPTRVDGPYPVDIGGNKPPVSKPIYLGIFDLSAMHRGR